MRFEAMRAELRDFYENTVNARAAAFCAEMTVRLDELAEPGMSPLAQKALQYRTIAAHISPVVFAHSPFYYEPGCMAAHCDGARDFRGHAHAGGWVYRRNYHLFKEMDPALYQRKKAQANELLYLICGPFNDVSQHFVLNCRPFLEKGISGVLEQTRALALKAQGTEKPEFYRATEAGLLALDEIAQKFAKEAKRCEENAKTAQERAHFARIAEAAAHTPRHAPRSFFEALNLLAFFRKIPGLLEGVGFSSFGRVDRDLYPFYRRDVDSGALTPAAAYDLICQFLITFDMHYDHDMKMVGYADHELENTYTLGGCDENGDPLYNELSEMFLRASREEKIIYPKIKARFSARSPKAYLDAINEAVIAGTSTVLYQNDDASIPALVQSGHTLQEARDYIVSGCWDMRAFGVEKPDAGNYVNLLKAFELSVHQQRDVMERVGLYFAPPDSAQSFDELYRITLDNIRVLFEERARITRLGAHLWRHVDALPIFSSTLADCLQNGVDFTAGGARYRNDHFLCFGFPNIVDSLLAINELCFVQKRCTLQALLQAVRANWQGFEELRAAALKAPGWGDGSAASCALGARLNADLYRLLEGIPGTYGGKICLGHLTYTEIKWWGEQTLATPDGRLAGDYFSQGLTPSRLKRIPAVTSVINSMAQLDASMMGGNSVLNVILPQTRMTKEICAAFLRAVAGSAVQSLQLNCTTKEQLLDAQKHPESYPDLIVRVCGFSAKFTSLSPAWQDEVLTRNFYE